MTIRDYITDKLRAFNITEAQLVDVYLRSGIDLGWDIEGLDPITVGRALTISLEEVLLAPRQNSISEGGFSVSWDYASAGKYYLHQCNLFGLEPHKDLVGMLNLSAIIDRTDAW